MATPKLACWIASTGCACLFAAQAFATVTPPNLCSDPSSCNAGMLSISNEFQKLSSAPDIQGAPTVFSGECYAVGFGTSPDQVQYGVALLDVQNGAYVYSGLLGFMYTSNPYASWDVQTARQALTSGGSSPTPISFADTYSEVDYLSSDGSIRYWFRQDPVSHDVILLSRWDLQHSQNEAFCRLSPNH